MDVGSYESKGVRRWKELGEGEDSPSVRLLEYISQYGTTKGAGIATGAGGAGIPSPKSRLLAGGYIEFLGGDKYQITEKGLEYLGTSGPYYERVKVQPSPGHLKGLERELEAGEAELQEMASRGEWEDWIKRGKELSPAAAALNELRRGYTFRRLR